MRMKQNNFWATLDRAREKVDGVVMKFGSQDARHRMSEALIKDLSMLGVSDIFTWQSILGFYVDILHKSKIWAAAHVINGKCSDDGFEYFRNWLITQGKDAVLKTLQDPESLADLKTCKRGFVQFEKLPYVAADAYNLKLGIKNQSYDEFIDEYSKFRPLREAVKEEIASGVVFGSDIDIDLSKGDTLLNLLPVLCKKFKWKGQSKVYIANKGSGIYVGCLNMSIQLPNNGRAISDYTEEEILKIMINDLIIEVSMDRLAV